MAVEALQLADTIEVSTGEVRAASIGVLRASALRSCVAVAMLNAEADIGGLAHVMLPGTSPDDQEPRHTRYAEDGIRELTQAMAAEGAIPDRLVAFLVGGGNIIERDDDTICEANIRSATQVLAAMGIRTAACEVGGTERRSISVDVKSSRIFYTIGDSASMLLWQGQGSEPGEGGDE